MAEHIQSVEIAAVMTADEASQAVTALHHLYWMERYDVSFVLPPAYAQIEPGDVITITASYATFDLRLTSTNTLPDGRIECRAKYNNAALYVQTAAGEEGQSVGATLKLAGNSVYQLLDIPLLRDDDNTAGFPAAMTGYMTGWPGGTLYRSDDNGATWADLRSFSPGQIMGYATNTLAAHGGTVLDKTGALSVWLHSGALSSVTELQMFNGQNWFAYGIDGRWEIIAAQNAVLQANGSYILTGFLRGQRGTEWATGLHAANDRLVKLSTATLAFISVNSSTIGSPRTYRGITSGKTLDSDASQIFIYKGVNLEPLSPVHLTGNRHPTTNDWTITWIRRSRYDQWRDLVEIPLGETAESYDVEIYGDGTYSAVKRTIQTANQNATYTDAQRVADFGSFSTALLLHMDGANAGTTFTDAAGKTVTAFGNAQTSTALSKFGGASGLFDGNGDYLETADHADWDFGSGDFTIDAWVYPHNDSAMAVMGVVARRGSSGSNNSWGLFINPTDGGFGFTGNDGAFAVSAAGIAYSAWSHIAVCRSGNTLLLFLNGVQVASAALTVAIKNYAQVVQVGRMSSGLTNGFYKGYIDELRVIKGYADYTANFTPPAAAHTITIVPRTLYLKIYQNSSIVGRGYPLIQSITR